MAYSPASHVNILPPDEVIINGVRVTGFALTWFLNAITKPRADAWFHFSLTEDGQNVTVTQYTKEELEKKVAEGSL